MIQDDLKVNINDDQPGNQPSPEHTDQEETANTINIENQNIDNNINNDDLNSSDNASQPNNTESTQYSFKPENSQKRPLILRLRNPPCNDKSQEPNKPTKSDDKSDADDDIPEEDKWKCPICLDALQQPVVTRCGHVFCWPCIHEWLRRSNACPVCHGEIEESHLIPIYGQGDEADISSPPPPRPEYREVHQNNGFNFAFRTPFTQPNIIEQVHNLFHPGPYLIIQIIVIIFFFVTFYI